ncbi:RagB/SusD family nutrient uptake outer membrane protein [Massilibacteroides sp.]|uniref:RagB/SusD family nutrient uptake outer membrane protein n=1 Tax=Massilibacteroides sp. TaxID=2034766 RepID=UPI0026100B4B|nr:RagB/SusD family nutrient uptake outer membrane protein [Massilibacteroides sp.]MDD4514425.1 RagB/SusD family nutrient uptake outer membrane protein [Massilibacteroides sp.]
MKFLKKRILYMLSAVVMLGGSMACSDFIDIDPENKLPEESVDFSKTENMYQPVVGVYAKVRTSGMHFANKLLLFGRDGDMWSGRTDDQGAAVDFGRHFNYTNSFWALNNVWVTFYEIIRIANSSLESLDGYATYLTPGTDDYSTYESYCAEVRTLRAWAYYQLVTNFGPIVLYKDNTQTEFRRSTIDAVYKYILEEDLNYAMEKLPRLRPNQMTHTGAVSAFTAKLLAAKVYLLQENYEQVETLTDDIINNGNFSLYSDYYSLFKIPGKLCDESLFECQVTDFGNGSGEYIGVDQWFNCEGPFSLKNPDTGTSFGGWGFMGYESEFVAWAENRGETVRAETSFLKAGSTTREGWVVSDAKGTSTDCWNGKGYLPYDQLTPGRTTYGQNNNVRVLRYAEVLLLNSEAKIRLGKNGDNGYNLVRERAQMPTKTGVTLSDVLDERRMELCSEWCNRYVDLVRTGEAATVLGPKGWTTEKTYWPLPASQLDDLSDLLLDPMD